MRKRKLRESRFCRSCGLSLETISQVVIQTVKETGKTTIGRNMSGQQKPIWQNPLLYGFLLLALGIVVITLGKKVIGEQLVADIGSLLSLVGVGFLILKGVFLLRASSNSPPLTNDESSKADATTELPPLLEAKPPLSVTEFTTRNFDPVLADQKKTKDS